MWPRDILALLVTPVLACATAPGSGARVSVTLDDLLKGAPLGPLREATSLVAEQEVLALSPEMRAFLDEHVSRGADRAARLQQLAHAIVGTDSFGLQYDETTRTAAETFRTRHGNCLSFSNMFVAMARQVDLPATFEEVDTPPDWSLRDDVFVLNRHVNVLVDLTGGLRPQERLTSLVRSFDSAGQHVVDFNVEDFRSSYDRRAISDERALAHFYNNVGVERMQAGDVTSAFLYFRKAVGHDPEFSPAWTNLGILYLREGHPQYSEAAYLQALQADGRDLVAMSNLASLYDRLGEQKLAAEYRSRVVDHRQENPYYRLQLARRAFVSGDYDAAMGHLKYAIRKKKNEDQLYYLLGLCYLKKGQEEEARRWLTRAEEVAATDSLKRRYSSKMDILLSAPPHEDKP